MKFPCISIIIPVYNQEKWLGRCLRSLLNQSIDRDLFEIIVINDASTDRTSNIIDLFKNEIKIINNKNNIGLPASLNKGIKLSRAHYIVRVDSDDYVNEYFLLFLHEYLEQNKEIDAVACDYYLVDNEEEVIERKSSLIDPIGCGIMFKSNQLFEVGLYDEDFRLNEEKELRIRFEKKYVIEYLKLPLYRYRRHQDNITNNKKDLKLHDKKMNNKHGKNKK